MTVRSISSFVFLVIWSGLLQPAVAQEYITKPKQSAAFAEVVEDPALPRVLIIGDSISIGYTPPLREILMGKVNVHRIPVNGGPTTRGVQNIDSWLGDTKWDLIHFNFGLHDLVYLTQEGKRSEPEGGQHQVPVEDYEKNLRLLIERMKTTGAVLVWRNTTPVPEGAPYRIAGDEKPYNEAAARLMKEYNIPTDDHHTYVMEHMEEVQLPQNVHFSPEGSRKLAELAAKAILENLPNKE